LLRESNITFIVEILASEIIKTEDVECIELFSLACQNLIQGALETSGPEIIRKFNQNLIKGLENKNAIPESTGEILEIYTDVFKRFSSLLLRDQTLIDKSKIMNAIMSKLAIVMPIRVRQKASHCMGAFSVVLNPQQLANLTNELCKRITASSTKPDKLVQVSCLSLVAKTVGSKLSPFLDQIVPMLARLMT
jgi:hypothetical protein